MTPYARALHGLTHSQRMAARRVAFLLRLDEMGSAPPSAEIMDLVMRHGLLTGPELLTTARVLLGLLPSQFT